MTEAEEMRSCPKCGKSIKAIATRCVWCFEKTEPARSPSKAAVVHTRAAATGDSAAGSTEPDVMQGLDRNRPSKGSRYATSVERRYRDAYVIAGDIVAQGQRMKTIAAIAAAVVVLLALLVAMRTGGLAIAVLIAGAVVAGGAYAGIHSLGVRIAAQGQHLLASLDVAVNTSPFLDDRGRAQAMSLYQTE